MIGDSSKDALAQQVELQAKLLEMQERLLEKEKELASKDKELAEAKETMQRLQSEHQDSSKTRREVVREMSQEWSGLSRVIESTLLEHSIHSPTTEKLLHLAEGAARAASSSWRGPKRST